LPGGDFEAMGSRPSIHLNQEFTQRGSAWQSRNQKQKRVNRGIRGKLHFACAQQILSKLSDLDT